MTKSKIDAQWIQRFSNYQKVLSQLQEFISRKDLSNLERQGLIKAFEYTYELSWNTIKDFYENQGETNIQGSKDAFRMAFKRGLVDAGEIWLDMVESRKLTVHSYDEVIAKKVEDLIFKDYFNQFLKLAAKLKTLQS